MNRPSKIRKIYAELRRALGDDIPAHELINTAAALLELYTEDDTGPHLRLVGGRVAFDQLPLDEALSDGGWRVMGRETGWYGEMYAEESSVLETMAKLKSLTTEMAA